MIIGLISDTHIPDRADKIPITVLEAFKNVDLIIHAGDLTSIRVKKRIRKKLLQCWQFKEIWIDITT